AAISKQRTVKFSYWSISRDQERERTVNPFALFQDGGAWYMVGQDLEAEDERTFRVSRIRGEIRFATRRERDFRLPTEFDVDRYAHEGRPKRLAAESDGHAVEEVERPAPPVAPERFAVLQALLAYLLDRCGEEKEAEIPAQDLVERFHIPADELEEHLSLLN